MSEERIAAGGKFFERRRAAVRNKRGWVPLAASLSIGLRLAGGESSRRRETDAVWVSKKRWECERRRRKRVSVEVATGSVCAFS